MKKKFSLYLLGLNFNKNAFDLQFTHNVRKYYCFTTLDFCPINIPVIIRGIVSDVNYTQLFTDDREFEIIYSAEY